MVAVLIFDFFYIYFFRTCVHGMVVVGVVGVAFDLSDR